VYDPATDVKYPKREAALLSPIVPAGAVRTTLRGLLAAAAAAAAKRCFQSCCCTSCIASHCSMLLVSCWLCTILVGFTVKHLPLDICPQVIVNTQPLAYYMDNFVTPEECEHFKEMATPQMSRARVSDTVAGQGSKVPGGVSGVRTNRQFLSSGKNSRIMQNGAVTYSPPATGPRNADNL
jgi:hypothetical protein